MDEINKGTRRKREICKEDGWRNKDRKKNESESKEIRRAHGRNIKMGNRKSGWKK
jgi:hypothetical protein